MQGLFGSTIPVAIIYISSLIGTGIAFGTNGVANFFWISIMYYILIALFKPKVCVDERNEVYKVGSRLFWAYVFISLFNNWTSDVWIVDLIYSCLYGGILYVFYKVFVNSLAVVKNIGIKKVFTAEEMISLVVLISIASIVFSNVVVLDMNVSNIIVMLTIMIVGWQTGILVSATAGIVSGFTMSLLQIGNLNLVLNLGLSGIFAGIFRKFGKVGVIVGFILANFVLAYISSDNTNLIIVIKEIFISSIILLIIPKNVKLELEDLIDSKKLLDNVGETRLEDKEKIIKKLNELYKNLENIFPQDKKIVSIDDEKFNKFKQIFLENIEEVKDNIFYEDLNAKNSNILIDIFNKSEKEDIILEDDLIEILKKNNSYIISEDELVKNNLKDIIKIINRTLKMIQIENVKIEETKKTIKITQKIQNEISKTIENTTNSILNKKDNKYEKKEIELKTILLGKNIPVKNIFIRQVKNGKYIVELEMETTDNSLREKGRIINIADVISKFLGSKMSFQKDRKNIDKNEYIQTYSSEDKYIMQVGSSKISKDDSMQSGDSNLQMRLDDGKYILAISDGMGTGKIARENSKLVIGKLKSLLENGFENGESISLINNSLSLKLDSDDYATLDICILDLYEGNISIIKYGACNTYIKNKKNISTIKSDDIPIGVGMDINLKEKNIPVSDGDIILMCSDGLLESKDEVKKDWIEEFLKNSSTNNVQRIADMIMAEAIDNNYGIAGDDITVIVAKVMKKK